VSTTSDRLIRHPRYLPQEVPVASEAPVAARRGRKRSQQRTLEPAETAAAARTEIHEHLLQLNDWLYMCKRSLRFAKSLWSPLQLLASHAQPQQSMLWWPQAS